MPPKKSSSTSPRQSATNKSTVTEASSSSTATAKKTSSSSSAAAAAARKAKPSSNNNNNNSNNSHLFTAAWIADATDSQLLSRLVDISTALEDMPSASSAYFSPSFLSEVCLRQYTCHPVPDVRIIIACIVADILRVAASAPSAAGVLVPFEDSAVRDVVNVVLETLGRLAGTRSHTVVEYIRHLLESLAVSHALPALLHKASTISASSRVSDDGSLLSSSSSSSHKHTEVSGEDTSQQQEDG